MNSKRVNSKQIYKCNFEKLLAYLKSDKIPKIEGYDMCHLVSIEDVNNKVTKIIRKELPMSSVGKLFMGVSNATFKYEIVYDDNLIVCFSENPKLISKYFQYKETLIIRKVEDIVEIERDVELKNIIGINPLSSFFVSSIEDLYHNSCIQYLNAILNESQEYIVK